MNIQGKVLLASVCGFAFLFGGAAVTVTDSFWQWGREAGANAPVSDVASFEPIAERSLSAVVQVEAFRHRRRPFGPETLEGFFIPGTHPKPDEADPELSSGVIVREDGYILTAGAHIPGADAIVVTLYDGTRHVARLAGVDPATGLVLLHIDAGGLTAPAFEDDAALAVGQFVMAVGSPLSPALRHSASVGVLSAKEETNGVLRVLRTDAALAPGSTGGPLFTLAGRVAGLARVADARSTAGVFHAWPAGLVALAVTRLLSRADKGVAHLGLTFDAEHDSGSGPVRVSGIEAGAAADRAGLRAGDLIVAAGGIPLQRPADLARRVAEALPGDTLVLDVLRAKVPHTFAVGLDALGSSDRPVGPTPDSPLSRLEFEMGFTVDDLTFELIRDMEIPASDGVVVLHVDPASAAYRESDLRGGMVIVEMAGQRVRDRDDFLRIYQHIPQDEYFLVICYTPLQSTPHMTALIKYCPGC